MKKFFYAFSTIFFLAIVSCTTEDLNEDIKAIDKDKIETPGGQSALEQSRIDKDKVETPQGN